MNEERTMKHMHAWMGALALAIAGLASPAAAGEPNGWTPYIGLAAGLHADVDPGDYEHIAPEFTARRDGSGAAGALWRRALRTTRPRRGMDVREGDAMVEDGHQRHGRRGSAQG